MEKCQKGQSGPIDTLLLYKLRFPVMKTLYVPTFNRLLFPYLSSIHFSNELKESVNQEHRKIWQRFKINNN